MVEVTQADQSAAEAWLNANNDEWIDTLNLAEAFARHRKYGYYQGYYDGRQLDGAEERAAIVAWLRRQGEFGSERAQAWGETFAEQVEAGEHLK